MLKLKTRLFYVNNLKRLIDVILTSIDPDYMDQVFVWGTSTLLSYCEKRLLYEI